MWECPNVWLVWYIYIWLTYLLVSKSHQSQLRLLSTNSVTRCLWVTHTKKLIYSIQQPLSIPIVSIYAASMIPIESGWTRHNVLIIPIFIILFCMWCINEWFYVLQLLPCEYCLAPKQLALHTPSCAALGISNSCGEYLQTLPYYRRPFRKWN